MLRGLGKAATAVLAAALTFSAMPVAQAEEPEDVSIESIYDNSSWIVGDHVQVSGACWDEQDDQRGVLQVRRGKKWVTVARATWLDDAAYCSDDEYPYLAVYEFTLTDAGRRYSNDRSYRLSVRLDGDPEVFSKAVYANQADYDADSGSDGW